MTKIIYNNEEINLIDKLDDGEEEFDLISNVDSENINDETVKGEENG